MGILKHKAGPDDFTYGNLTWDWIVLEERSMCLVHPVAFISDWHILSGCLAVVSVYVWLHAYIQLPEIESRAKCELR